MQTRSSKVRSNEMIHASSAWQARSSRESGFALLMTGLIILILLPVVGLSIDAAVLYVIKTKLSMAVDAGAIAGARALSRGASDSQQIASAQEAAEAYVRANYQPGFLGGASLETPDPVIDMSAGNRRSVTVTASVAAPLYFLRILGMNSSNVAASATAVRRDVNLVVVLDRSGSLQSSNSCDAVKANAANFVGRFSEGRDNVGLVTFASSSRDDFPASSNFQTASPTVVETINSITCTGATNSAQGLWQAYTQLAALNQPGALNVILFFTDGQPTAFTSNFTPKTASTCAEKGSRTAVLTVAGNSTNVAVVNYGLLNHIAPAQPMTSDITIAPDSLGCAYAAIWPSTANLVALDFEKLPKKDIYGNKLVSGYQTVAGATSVSDDDPDSGADVTPANIHAAAINAADDAGLRIRKGEQVASLGRGLNNVVVFSIGLGNSTGGIEHDFMRRVSNDPQASNYDPSYAPGLFVFAPQASDLTRAFNRIASEILRLAK